MIMKKRQPVIQQFALCLNNEDYPASLEIGKVYRVIPDKEASAHGYIRVLDESGEDYAYSIDRFHVMALPQEVRHALLSASKKVAA
jgi:hypothetical protein